MYADFSFTADCHLEFSDKRKLIVSPGAALSASGLNFPFFVLEVAIMQTRKEVQEKVQRYLEGSGGHLKTLALLELLRTPTNGYRVLLSIWRIKKNLYQTADGSMAHQMTKGVLWNAVEVYPRQARGYLRIWMKDVLTAGDAVDAEDESVDIEFKTLHVLARVAVELQLLDDDRNE